MSWKDKALEKLTAEKKSAKRWIDPQKESATDRTALQSGQKTFQDLQAEKGRDWKEVVDEMAEAVAYGREKGIDLGGIIFGTGTADPAGGGQSDPDDDNGGGPGGRGGEP